MYEGEFRLNKQNALLLKEGFDFGHTKPIEAMEALNPVCISLSFVVTVLT
jgi:hypothetical protein